MRREGRIRTWRPKPTCLCGHTNEIHQPKWHASAACKFVGCGCVAFRLKGAFKKVTAKKQNFKGLKYDSGTEARVAADLNFQLERGELVEVKKKFPIDIFINGHYIIRHYVDFRIVWADGTVELVEAKGIQFPDWLIRRRLLEAVYLKENPDVKYRIVTS